MGKRAHNSKENSTQATHLDKLVPASRDNHRVLGVGREAHARNPLGVALISNGELAVAQGIPQLNRPVARARDDLTVVGRERNGQDVVGVADETAGGCAGGQLPQTERLVPRGRQGVCAI